MTKEAYSIAIENVIELSGCIVNNVPPDAKRIAELCLITDVGKRICRVEYAKGDPENPLSRAELEQKFRQLMCWAGQKQKSGEILREVFSPDLEKVRYFQ